VNLTGVSKSRWIHKSPHVTSSVANDLSVTTPTTIDSRLASAYVDNVLYSSLFSSI